MSTPDTARQVSGRRLGAWLIAGAAGFLGVALCLPRSAPDWLFWGATVLSLAAAFAWGLTRPPT